MKTRVGDVNFGKSFNFEGMDRLFLHVAFWSDHSQASQLPELDDLNGGARNDAAQHFLAERRSQLEEQGARVDP